MKKIFALIVTAVAMPVLNTCLKVWHKVKKTFGKSPPKA